MSDFDAKSRNEWLLNEIRKNTEGIKEPFVVSLTPTSTDFSGTMDKTVKEINEAMAERRDIWFSVIIPGVGEMSTPLQSFSYANGFVHPSYNAWFLYADIHAIIFLYTANTNDETKATYGTIIYPLTPLQ